MSAGLEMTFCGLAFVVGIFTVSEFFRATGVLRWGLRSSFRLEGGVGLGCVYGFLCFV